MKRLICSALFSNPRVPQGNFFRFWHKQQKPTGSLAGGTFACLMRTFPSRTSLFDQIFGERYYPLLIDGGMQFGNSQANDHYQETRDMRHRWSDNHPYELIGSEQRRLLRPLQDLR